MEYLDGVELAEVIDREDAISVSRVLRIGVQICRALAAAHEVGIIHRDLKPENVFLTHRQGANDFVKVLDFGIAKSTEAEQARDKRLTSPGMAMGTPEYMSPEQAAGRPADERCDIYSLGAILYESLTGVPPYEGENFMEILTKKATVDPRPARELRPELPDAVTDLVQRAMSRNPSDRPPSMVNFEYELTKSLSGRGAAVSRVLGIDTEPALLASMNPGVNIALEERGLASMTSGEHKTPTPRPRSQSAGSSASMLLPQHPDSGTFEGIEFDTASVHAHRHSSMGLFGWILLIALLFAGVGVVLFVATGERRGDGSGGNGAASANGLRGFGAQPGTEVPATPAEPKVAPPVAKKRDPKPASSASSSAGNAAKDSGPDGVLAPNDGAKPKVDKPRSVRKADRNSGLPVGIPRSRRDARKLLREASKQTAQLHWSEARAIYQRIADGRHLRAKGYVGLARIAFQTKDAKGAIRHAKKAISAGASTDAWKVMGHAFLKQGRYADALTYYERVLKENPSDKEAQSAAAVARRQLGR